MPAPLILDEHLGFLLRRAQQRHVAIWAAVVSTEVTSAQYGILNELALCPGLDQRTLGERLQIDRSTMAEIVTRMTRRGLVTHVRDRHDQRRKVLSLTDEGANLHAQLTPKSLDANRLLARSLDDEQLDLLKMLLHMLLAASPARPSR